VFDGAYSVDEAVSAEAVDTASEVERIPARDEPFSALHPDALRRDAQAERIDNRTARVVVNYDSDDGDSDDDSGDETSPLDAPAAYAWTGTQTAEPYTRDVNGEIVATSAGELFDSQPVRVVSRPRLTITRNVGSVNANQLDLATDTINSASFSVPVIQITFAEGTARADSIDFRGPLEENGVTYFQRTTVLALNRRGWDDTFEDRGLYELDDDGNLTPITDAEGNPVLTPYPLDGEGSAASSATAAPAEIEREPYERSNLAVYA